MKYAILAYIYIYIYIIIIITIIISLSVSLIIRYALYARVAPAAEDEKTQCDEGARQDL